MEKANIHNGHRERLRRIASNGGIENMEEHQALELLLSYFIPRVDVNPIAHNLMQHFHSFNGVVNADASELTKIKGISSRTAQFIVSIKDFLFLYQKNKAKGYGKINSCRIAVNFVQDILQDKPYEEMFIICLDGDSNVKCFERVNRGNGKTVSVSVRALTGTVLKHNAYNVILCHNHPNGIARPSAEDDKLTKAVLANMALNEIHLLDHIVVTSGEDYYSYAKDGKLNDYMKEIKDLITGPLSAVMQNKCKYEA